MVKLEDISAGSRLKGIHGETVVEVRAVSKYGESVEVDYRLPDGKIQSRLLTRDDERSIDLVAVDEGSFTADADDFKLASEAHRILLAGRFDPFLAVRLSTVDPLPHQIDAVYNQMLPKLPLRYVLADDPGAGKTVMTGLLVKEMLIRGDVERCLIVVPGSICEQWRDELKGKFDLDFEILTNDLIHAASAAGANPFSTHKLLIARLDKLSRDEAVQALLRASTWDLVVVDEAHKLAAHVMGREVKETKRYKLGRLLGTITEHLLLLTATPHNGHAGDFQLFMQLVDPDRFEGGAHFDPKTQREPKVDDVMRRMLKEQLLKFDGTPLFPERRSYTVNYGLSVQERALYDAVTSYVREEFNRAERLDPSKRNAVGFALTLLQRRLASSPAAIHESLLRRKARLEGHLREAREGLKGRVGAPSLPNVSDFDEDDLTANELEETEELLVGTVLTSQTLEELEAEIRTLERLSKQAEIVRYSREDMKWSELSRVIQENGELFGAAGRREKLIIFTEFTDTLVYLRERVANLLGDPDAVVTIHGGLNHAARREVEAAFRQDENVRVLIATDAAGESINLQYAHLMVSYDLPWNPNRLEQRFGRIHRIGQTEVCHLWNLVSWETREGEVYGRLLEKLEEERRALGGRVYDVLGLLTFGEDRHLSDLLRDAVRYGDDPKVRERLQQTVSQATDLEALRRVLDERALDDTIMGEARVRSIREHMERELAHRLEPHFVASCFMQALRRLGGVCTQPEAGRLRIAKVPKAVRERALELYGERAVQRSYERVCFDRAAVDAAKPQALFVYPGHPLVDSVLLALLDEIGDARARGTALVDDHDWDVVPRLLFSVEGEVCDGRTTASSAQHVLERYLSFVEIPGTGDGGGSPEPIPAGNARYLDYRAPREAEVAVIGEYLAREAPFGDDAWSRARAYAVGHIAAERRDAVSRKRLPRIERVRNAVSKRLSSEISYAEYQALEAAEKARKSPNYELVAANAWARVDELRDRRAARLSELEREISIFATPPRVSGCSIVIPRGLLCVLLDVSEDVAERKRQKQRIEAVAMNEVIKTEEMLGYAPTDVSHLNVGYDVESSIDGAQNDPDEPLLRFIEVKGVSAHVGEVTVTTNEVQQALNNPDSFILAIVEIDSASREEPLVLRTTYLRRPFENRLDAAGTKATYGLEGLMRQGQIIYRQEGAL